MTTTDPYTIDSFGSDKRFTLSTTITDPGRLHSLAKYCRGRRFSDGYILTPFRAQKFDALYRAGFEVCRGRLVHPMTPGKTYSASEAMNIILLSARIGD